MKVLVTRYKMRDLVAWYLDEYAARVLIPWLKKNKFEVIDLCESKDTYENVTKALQDKDVKICVFAGHGADSFVTGYEFYPILVACQNDKYLKGKEVNAAACLTARVLGKSAVSKGCKLYCGFMQPAYLVLSHYCENVHDCPLVDTYDPLKDELAYPFLDTMFYPTKLMCMGYSPDKIYKLTYDRYTYWIKYYFGLAVTKKKEEYLEVAKCLLANRKNFVVYPVYTIPNVAQVLIPLSLAAAGVVFYYVMPIVVKSFVHRPAGTH